jgi:hypothetical protein
MGTHQDLVSEQIQKDREAREQEQRDAALYINRQALRESWPEEDRVEILAAFGLDTSPLP